MTTVKRNWFLQAIIILAISAAAALVLNSARGGGVALVGNWPSHSSAGGPVIPPSAEPGDPPFITLEDAVTKYQSTDVVFVDSRSPEDYEYGHIRSAINIPFDYIDPQWDAFIDSLDRGRAYVVYCGGGECETSLFLGRYLLDLGFENIYIFFGGWQEWIDNRLPIAVPESSGEGGSR